MWGLGLAASVVLASAMVTTGCAIASRQVRSPVPPTTNANANANVNVTLASVVEATLVDAATRAGLPGASLQVASAEAVTSADGSLGCPSPGMSYTMALVPGYRIRVRAGDQVLDYHANQRGHFLVCPQDQSVDPAGNVTK
jgi:hypothetical protein